MSNNIHDYLINRISHITEEAAVSKFCKDMELQTQNCKFASYNSPVKCTKLVVLNKTPATKQCGQCKSYICDTCFRYVYTVIHIDLHTFKY